MADPEIHLNPGQTERLALLLVARDRFDDAVGLYPRPCRRPCPASVRIAIGNKILATNPDDLDRAVEQYRCVPQDRAASELIACGDAYCRRKTDENYEKAIRVYGRAHATDRLVSLAISLFNAGESWQIRRSWSAWEASKSYPTAEVCERIGDAFVESGQHKEAIELYGKAGATAKLVALGEEHGVAGRHELAVKAYAAANDAARLEALADTLFAAKSDQLANRALRLAVSLTPTE